MIMEVNFVLGLLQNLWFNVFLFTLLGMAIIGCIRRYVKGKKAYCYYGVFFIGLVLVRIIQLFQNSFLPRSIPGIITSSMVTLILLISFFSFYIGYRKEKSEKVRKTGSKPPHLTKFN